MATCVPSLDMYSSAANLACASVDGFIVSERFLHNVRRCEIRQEVSPARPSNSPVLRADLFVCRSRSSSGRRRTVSARALCQTTGQCGSRLSWRSCKRAESATKRYWMLSSELGGWHDN